MKGKDTKAAKDKKRKPHYKKKPDGIYNKKLSKGKSKNKNVNIDNLIEELVVQAQHQAHVNEPSEEAPVLQQEEEAAAAVVQSAEEPTETPEAEPRAPIAEASPREKKPMTAGFRFVLQTAMAGAFVCMGLILLLSTAFLVYYPMREQNEALSHEKLSTRMELSLLIADVFPSMKVDDELNDLLLRALENRENSLRKEGNAIVKEIDSLRADAVIAELLEEVDYTNADFAGIVKDSEQTRVCLDAVNAPISVIDAKIEGMGVAKLKEDIAVYKGTVTTVTKENENGETVTETVVTGGLVPEMQAKKNELQKKHDDLKAKLDALDAYIHDNQNKITAMYNRLEDAPKVESVYTKMETISAYVKENPEDHIFLKDIDDKLASFPGESKEEDDILFIMKVEAETGIRMQTVNYGQDYQHKKLSNGMVLCFELYSIPYYATYPGLKNLIAYFNDNDDFYASVYNLSMQYNSANESIQGVIMILHYYILAPDAEYVPPVISENITPGIDGIFGEVTDNGKPNGQLSNYTPEQIEEWLDSGMTLEEVRQKLTDENYPETELLWILKKKYKTGNEIKGFLAEYGDPDVDYEDQVAMLGYLQKVFPNTDLATLIEIYNAKVPEDTTGSETPKDPEDTGEETTQTPEDATENE